LRVGVTGGAGDVMGAVADHQNSRSAIADREIPLIVHRRPGLRVVSGRKTCPERREIATQRPALRDGARPPR